MQTCFHQVCYGHGNTSAKIIYHFIINVLSVMKSACLRDVFIKNLECNSDLLERSCKSSKGLRVTFIILRNDKWRFSCTLALTCQNMFLYVYVYMRLNSACVYSRKDLFSGLSQNMAQPCTTLPPSQ